MGFAKRMHIIAKKYQQIEFVNIFIFFLHAIIFKNIIIPAFLQKLRSNPALTSPLIHIVF